MTNFRVETPVIDELNNLMVRDLMVSGCNQWDVEMIQDMFQPRVVAAI